MSDYASVLVYGETVEGELASLTLELLGAGKRLASTLRQELSIVFIGSEADNCGQEAIAYGAEVVYVVDDPSYEYYEGASYAAVLERLCRETVRPAIVLFGQTLLGRDLAPRLAFKLDAGLIMDCIWLDIEQQSGRLLAKRPVAGGNIEATYRLEGEGSQLATVRSKVMEALERDDTRRGDIHHLSLDTDISVPRANVLEEVKEDIVGPKLETAEVIVSGGRGVGTAEDFESYITQALAKVLGAAVGGTRAAVDLGILSEQQQVGLTGKIVSPNLYFAVALSGAPQHITGCSGSKHIVAINKDQNAPVFGYAEFGIVGDYRKVLPPLTQKLKEVLS